MRPIVRRRRRLGRPMSSKRADPARRGSKAAPRRSAISVRLRQSFRLRGGAGRAAGRTQFAAAAAARTLCRTDFRHVVYRPACAKTAAPGPIASSLRSVHRPYARIDNGLIRSAPFDDVDATPTQLRWSPIPIPQTADRFRRGHRHARRQRRRGDAGRHGGAHLRRQPLDDRSLFLQRRRRNADRAAAGPRPLRHRAWRDRGAVRARSSSSRAACAFASSCRTDRRAATSAKTTAPCCGCRSSARSARTGSPIRAIF